MDPQLTTDFPERELAHLVKATNIVLRAGASRNEPARRSRACYTGASASSGVLFGGEEPYIVYASASAASFFIVMGDAVSVVVCCACEGAAFSSFCFAKEIPNTILEWISTAASKPSTSPSCAKLVQILT